MRRDRTRAKGTDRVVGHGGSLAYEAEMPIGAGPVANQTWYSRQGDRGGAGSPSASGKGKTDSFARVFPRFCNGLARVFEAFRDLMNQVSRQVPHET